MKQTLSISLMFTIICISSVAQAQWFTTGNPAVLGTDYLGPQNAANLNFQTATTPRMRIMGTGGAIDGFIGIGDYTTFNPRSLVHLHDNGPTADVFQQFTNGNTGSGSNTSGYRMGIEYNATRTASDATFRNYSPDSRFLFSSTDITGSLQTRMRMEDHVIAGWPVMPVNRVKIVEEETWIGSGLINQPPCALLHLGHNWTPNDGGHRLWMDVGTFTNAYSDYMYTGTKNVDYNDFTFPWSYHMNAVISWGDNINGTEGADDMQVLFTALQIPANGDAGLVDGLEVMRFTPFARVGIGNFTDPTHGNGSGIRPFRRLEIYDEHKLDIGNGTHYPDAPQLRLTYEPDALVNLGIWTDFQTTSIGDLYIHPSSNQVDRRVGINTSTPGNTLEINALDPDGTPPNIIPGASGLRFNDLTDGSTPNSNPKKVVLSVDPNGDVILVRDDGGGNLSACGSLPTNYITKAIGSSTICKTTIYETSPLIPNEPLVGIGVGAAPTAKLDVFNDRPKTGVNTGILVNSNFGTTATHSYGIRSYASSNQGAAIGLLTDATGNGISSSLASAYGVYSQTHSTAFCQNYGIYNEVTGSGTGTGYLSIVTGVTGTSAGMAPSTGANLTVSTGTDITGIGLNSNNGSFNNIGIISRCYTNTTNTGSINRGYVATMDGGEECNGVACGIANNYANGQINIAYKASVTGRGSSSQNYGAQYVVASSAKGIINYGIYTYVGSAIQIPQNFGAYHESVNGTINTGVFGWAYNTTDLIVDNTGVVGTAGHYLSKTAHNNIGVHAIAADGTNLNYGIWAEGGNGHCVTNPTTTNCPNAAGFFSGDIGVTNSVFQSSDQFLKDSIQPISNPIGIINQLNPVAYIYRTQQYPTLNLSDGTHYGLIAEDLKPILPELVRGFIQPAEKDSLGNVVNPEVNFQAINYTALIPFLIAGMKELLQQINDLQTQINNCCGAPRPLAPSQGNNEKTRAIDVKLTNNDNSAILYQNEPNPYHSATTIRYFIPENVRDVKITFQDATGKTLKEVTVSETGQGSINVDGSDLISGTYTYSLVVSGKVIDTKKMVKVK